jgi:hypothetical protein
MQMTARQRTSRWLTWPQAVAFLLGVVLLLLLWKANRPVIGWALLFAAMLGWTIWNNRHNEPRR